MTGSLSSVPYLSAQSSDGAAVAFAEIGPVELKGVDGPIQLHIARRT